MTIWGGGLAVRWKGAGGGIKMQILSEQESKGECLCRKHWLCPGGGNVFGKRWRKSIFQSFRRGNHEQRDFKQGSSWADFSEHGGNVQTLENKILHGMVSTWGGMGHERRSHNTSPAAHCKERFRQRHWMQRPFRQRVHLSDWDVPDLGHKYQHVPGPEIKRDERWRSSHKASQERQITAKAD